MSSVIENAAKEADQLLRGNTIALLTDHEKHVFLFCIDNRNDSFDVYCVPGTALSIDQYLIIAGMQYNVKKYKHGTVSFSICIDYWFYDPNCKYTPTWNCDVDKESLGCLYGKSIPYDPCQDYIFVNSR